MKRILLLMMIAALSIGQSRAQVEATNPQFRKSRWGDSLADVYAIEKQRDIQTGDTDIYAFESSIVDMDCYVAYYFIDKKLVRGRYIINEKHLNDDQYIYDYEGLVNLLKSKYGDPTSTTEKWREKRYENDYDDNRGTAVSKGYLTYKTSWTLKDTDITITLYSYDLQIRIFIDYASLAHMIEIEEDMVEGL